MKWLLLWLLGTTGAAIVLACIVLLFVRGRLRRHHRVAPGQPTDAPVTWLVDPRSPARLHRRLAKVGRLATTIGETHRPRGRRLRKAEEPPAIVAVAQDLVAQAVALDHQLARIALLAPSARRRPLVELARAVEQVEEAGTRLVALSSELLAPRRLHADDPGLLDVAGQVERLAEAHQALRDLDDDAGLAASPLPAPPLRPEAALRPDAVLPPPPDRPGQASR